MHDIEEVPSLSRQYALKNGNTYTRCLFKCKSCENFVSKDQPNPPGTVPCKKRDPSSPTQDPALAVVEVG